MLDETRNKLDRKTLSLNRIVSDYTDSALKEMGKLKNGVLNIYNNNKVLASLENKLKFFVVPENYSVINELKKLDEFLFSANNGNLGDVIIAEAEYQIFESLGLNYAMLDLYNKGKENEWLKYSNYVYGGGGLFCGLYNYENVKATFQYNHFRKIIILPSSFSKCDDLLEVFDERFIVFCREKRSYDYCISINKKARIILAHDMAFGLDYGFIAQKSNLVTNAVSHFDKKYSTLLYESYSCFMITSRNIMQAINEKTLRLENNLKLGILLRSDIESNLSEDYKNKYLQNSLDLSNFGWISCTDAGLVKGLSLLFIMSLNYFDIIVTDRLHIGITSAILGKKVYMLDNSYGKLSGVYNQSMRSFNNVKMINTISEIEEEIGNSIDFENINKTNTNTTFNIDLTFQEFLTIYFSAYNPENIVTKTFLNTIIDEQN